MKSKPVIPELLICNPYNSFDTSLIKNIDSIGEQPIVSLACLSRSELQRLNELIQNLNVNVGLDLRGYKGETIDFSNSVNLVIYDFNSYLGQNISNDTYCILSVTSLDDIKAADLSKPDAILVKGSESAGKVGNMTTFMLLQQLKSRIDKPIYVQGGVGIHTFPALKAAGAYGAYLDYQITFFPQLTIDQNLKDRLSPLTGGETSVNNSTRTYELPALNTPEETKSSPATRNRLANGGDRIFMSMDIGLAKKYADQYSSLRSFIDSLKKNIYAAQKLAKHHRPLQKNSAIATDLGIEYPIFQGPMTRVSDVPSFANSIAQGGAMPFVALSMMKGQKANDLLNETRLLVGEKPWGVGMLGFNSTEIWEEQLKMVIDTKPSVAIIAGGRPTQSRELEANGIEVFLHVPSPTLLDNFIKQGSRNFIFEGQECGGHIGPQSSLVLWDMQIDRLLKEDSLKGYKIVLAGGVHDDISAFMASIVLAPLVAKGAQVAVIVGTAYLYTNEIVETGAISEHFQNQVIKGSSTTLLESSPGHVIRCLPSPFTKQFNKKKDELLSQGLSKREVGLALDKINVGRLRIATKGIDRKGDSIIPLEPSEQTKEGLYMVGQSVAMTNGVKSIRSLHEEISLKGTELLENCTPELRQSKESNAVDIAIVGMGCIFPDARNLDEYWKNILEGKDSIVEVPSERWDPEMYYSGDQRIEGKSTSKWGGFIPEITFDPVKFGIPPNSLQSIDLSQLLSLQVAYDALEDAGYNDKDFDRENTSVIFGIETGSELNFGYELRSYLPKYFGELTQKADDALPNFTEDSFPGVLANVVSGRISNRLNFGGRNYSVDAACASSLTAVDLACQELRAGRSNVALAGAVDLHNDIADYVKFSSAQALGFSGRCKTFDASADGITLGEGVAVLVLKRLEDAHLDGDKIYSVIRSVEGSSDGKSLGLTAPRKKGQMLAFDRAYAQAGIPASAIGLYEAHGTGTVVGDKTELQSITELMISSGAVPGQTHAGSVKTQIGHTKCAAGLAALIKSSLAVYHGVKPPTLHIETPNEIYDEKLSPLTFNKRITPWMESKRFSGISAFGFGGTNFHAVIENHKENSANMISKLWPKEIFVFRANSDVKLKELLDEVLHLINQNRDLACLDLSYCLAYRNNEEVRLTVVAGSLEELKDKIISYKNDEIVSGVYSTNPVEGKVAFLFSGQGSQKINMAQDLFVYFPKLRKWIKNKEHEQVLFPNRTFDKTTLQVQKSRIKDTRNAQPLLGIVDMALAQLYSELGIKADMVAGHSYGEIAALCFAGVLKANELINISQLRADCTLKAIENDPGAMLAIMADEDKVRKLTAEFDDIYLANINSPSQTVIAGSTAAIQELEHKLNNDKVVYSKVEVACAFHSPLVGKAEELFRSTLDQFSISVPTMPVYSNQTGELYPDDGLAIKDHIASQVVSSVRFSSELQTMHNAGASVFIEAGPGKILSNLVEQTLDDVFTLNAITGNPERNGMVEFVNFLAKYLSTGREISFEAVFADRVPSISSWEELSNSLLSKTAWRLNGHKAIPPTGMSDNFQDKRLLTEPISNLDANASMVIRGNDPAENLVLNYLENMNQMIESQKQVMLGLLDKSSIAQIKSVNTVNSSTPINTAAASKINPSPKNEEIETSSPTDLIGIVLSTISEKTGYPKDMLDINMDLESDLSIDSIKRIEIINTLQERLKMTSISETSSVEKFTGLKTIRELIENLETSHASREFGNASQLSETNSGFVNEDDIEKRILHLVSEKTGYPADMLSMDMDLESDLSIDSIKRIEIINAINQEFSNNLEVTSEFLIETMAPFKNLGTMKIWIQENGKFNDSLNVKTESFANHSTDSQSIESVELTLLKSVSEKTGYPIDMLTLDMDLEADLSIDSIKRLEIFNHLLESENIHGDEKQKIIEKLRTHKTLESIVGFLEGNTTLKIQHEDFFKPQELEEKKDRPEKISRIKIVKTKSLAASQPERELKGKKFVIIDSDNSLSAKMKSCLVYHQAEAMVYNELAAISDIGLNIDGLIYVDRGSPNPQLEISRFCDVVRALGSIAPKWIFCISSSFSEFNTNQSLLTSGFNGLLNSLNKEWKTICKTLHLEDKDSIENAPNLVVEEFLYVDKEFSEVYFENGQRLVSELIELPIEKKDKSLTLSKEDVVLVLGGAQGITAEIVKHLSSINPCHYILVGRSELRKVDPALAASGSLDEVKKNIVKYQKFDTPKALEAEARAIYKSLQIQEAIEVIQSHGSEVEYVSLDVTNSSLLKALLEKVYVQRGRIDGVIHAAGFIDDKLFLDKSQESFDQVYATKTEPLEVLMKSLRKETKFVVMFSSISSVAGNRGQTDYAAANSVLDGSSHLLSNKILGKVISINWGPWKGKGMMNPLLEKEFENRGIMSIGVPEGIEAFMNELFYGAETQIILIPRLETLAQV